MFGSLIDSLTDGLDSFKTKAILYIVLAVFVLVILSVLLDGIRKYIRGLDTAVFGGLVIWLAYEANQYSLTKSAAVYIFAAGGALLVSGIIVFMISNSIRSSRNRRRTMDGPPMPEKHLAEEDAEQ